VTPPSTCCRDPLVPAASAGHTTSAVTGASDGQDPPGIAAEVEGLQAKVQALFAGYADSVPFLSAEQLPELMKPEADWSGLAPYILARVKACNALGGPRMQVVPWKALEVLGHLPQYPDPEDSRFILDAESLLEEWVARQDEQGRVGGRIICFSFFSHRWERPSMDPTLAHPDDAEHKKAKALTTYGRLGTCSIFSPTWTFEYFFWIDYAGVNQWNPREKALAITMLSAWVSACVEIIMYNSSTADYEPRAWTRVERMLGFTYCISPSSSTWTTTTPTRPLTSTLWPRSTRAPSASTRAPAL